MNFAYEIYPSERAIVARYAGRFNLAGLVATAEQLWSDPRYSPTYDGFVDLTDTALGVDMCDFRPLLAFIRAHKQTSQGRWAAVTTSPMAAAMGLIYKQAMVSRHVFEIFSTREAAGWFVGFEIGDPILGGKGPRRYRPPPVS